MEREKETLFVGGGTRDFKSMETVFFLEFNFSASTSSFLLLYCSWCSKVHKTLRGDSQASPESYPWHRAHPKLPYEQQDHFLSIHRHVGKHFHLHPPIIPSPST